MAVIGSIRNRGKLVAGIVFGALALFVLDALFNGRNKGHGRADEDIAEINGDAISVQEFSTRCDEQENIYRGNGTTVDNQLQEQIRNGVWNEIIHEHTLKYQAEEAGFGTTIGKDEYDDIRFGDNIVPDFKSQQFQDPKTGQPDKDKLRQYFKYIQEQKPEIYDLQKRTLVPQRIYAKYNMLVKKSCFVNSAQVKETWAAKNTKATFTFVAKRLEQEPDSLYPVNDEDLRRYYDAHKGEKKWQQKASRGFAFVKFQASPTPEDIAATEAEMKEWKTDFEATHGKADSLFVAGHATTKNAAAAPYTEGTADKFNDSLITHADTGMVVGPYKDGENWKLVKVKELVDIPEARVRHILLMTQGKSEDVVAKQKARADSILAVVKRDKSKFEALVTKFTEDPGSKNTGGVYEWFDKTRMVPEFTKASFDEKIGAITVCKTSYGYHVVEVLGQRTRKERRVLTVDQKVEPVQALKQMYKTSNEFSLKNADTASFRKAATEQSLAYTPVNELKADQPYVPGVQDPKSMVSWVNHATPESKASEPIQIGDAYYVCVLTAIRAEGTPELKDVREQMTKDARKDKKADALATKMTGKTDLNALAKELATTVQSVPDLPFSSFSLPGGFSDNEVIGKIFALQNGTTSAPLKGDQGVYVASMTTLTPAGEMPENAEDKKPLVDKVRNSAEYQAFNALKEMAHVKDDRSKFY